MTASHGLPSELRRRENVVVLVVAALTLIWIVVGSLTFAKGNRPTFIGGGVTALIGAFAIFIVAFKEARSGRLRWK